VRLPGPELGFWSHRLVRASERVAVCVDGRIGLERVVTLLGVEPSDLTKMVDACEGGLAADPHVTDGVDDLHTDTRR
jgi:hypothetical protein